MVSVVKVSIRALDRVAFTRTPRLKETIKVGRRNQTSGGNKLIQMMMQGPSTSRAREVIQASGRNMTAIATTKTSSRDIRKNRMSSIRDKKNEGRRRGHSIQTTMISKIHRVTSTELSSPRL